MIHAMLDIETLSLDEDAVITNVAIVAFDTVTKTITAEAVWPLEWRDQHDRSVSKSTIAWWLTQSAEARAELINTPRVTTDEFRLQLFSFWNAHQCEAVWAHGAGFDPPRVQSLINCAPPWSYRNVFDTRTLFMLANATIDQLAGDNLAMVKHTALDDAIYQTHAVLRALSMLKAPLPPIGA